MDSILGPQENAEMDSILGPQDEPTARHDDFDTFDFDLDIDPVGNALEASKSTVKSYWDSLTSMFKAKPSTDAGPLEAEGKHHVKADATAKMVGADHEEDDPTAWHDDLDKIDFDLDINPVGNALEAGKSKIQSYWDSAAGERHPAKTKPPVPPTKQDEPTAW